MSGIYLLKNLRVDISDNFEVYPELMREVSLRMTLEERIKFCIDISEKMKANSNFKFDDGDNFVLSKG
jgi:hypothetical protein